MQFLDIFTMMAIDSALENNDMEAVEKLNELLTDDKMKFSTKVILKTGIFDDSDFAKKLSKIPADACKSILAYLEEIEKLLNEEEK